MFLWLCGVDERGRLRELVFRHVRERVFELELEHERFQQQWIAERREQQREREQHQRQFELRREQQQRLVERLRVSRRLVAFGKLSVPPK